MTNNPRKPLGEFFQCRPIHSSHKLCPVNLVDGQNMVLVEDESVALVHTVQSRFHQGIINDTSQEVAVTLGNPDPEIFTPTAGWDMLFGQRYQRCGMIVSQDRF